MFAPTLATQLSGDLSGGPTDITIQMEMSKCVTFQRNHRGGGVGPRDAYASKNRSDIGILKEKSWTNVSIEKILNVSKERKCQKRN